MCVGGTIYFLILIAFTFFTPAYSLQNKCLFLCVQALSFRGILSGEFFKELSEKKKEERTEERFVKEGPLIRQAARQEAAFNK